MPTALRSSLALNPPFQVSCRQHIGDRGEQQDRALSCRLGIVPGTVDRRDRRLLAVADGMGGMGDGALAADTAVRVLKGHVRAAWDPHFTRQSQLIGAFRATHEDVANALTADGGCALTACYVRGGPGGIACFAHAGDVLGALLRHDGVRWQFVHRTQPHRLARNVLSNAIGTARAHGDATVSGDIPLEPGDVIILASDGVSDSVDDRFMLRVAAHPPAMCAKALLGAALEKATTGRDNATVMVARVSHRFLS